MTHLRAQDTFKKQERLEPVKFGRPFAKMVSGGDERG